MFRQKSKEEEIILYKYRTALSWDIVFGNVNIDKIGDKDCTMWYWLLLYWIINFFFLIIFLSDILFQDISNIGINKFLKDFKSLILELLKKRLNVFFGKILEIINVIFIKIFNSCQNRYFPQKNNKKKR